METSPSAEQVHAGLTRDQRIGQLFMVATAVGTVSDDVRSAVGDQHVGNVLLTGRWTQGADHVRAVTTEVQRLTESRDATGGVRAFVCADQEGGRGQTLCGPGYSEIPSAQEQGAQETDTLRRQAHRWGAELSRSGVTTILGPVLDVSRQERAYGHDPEVVTDKGGAVQHGMARAGVGTVVKHFPGLGRATGDTATANGVEDTATTSDDACLAPFAHVVEEGSPFVMVSSATYTEIDAAQPALFSPTVIGSLLREGLGFDGIVVSDDVGGATAPAGRGPGARAAAFLDAGGDLVLATTTDTLPRMVAAVQERAESEEDFAATVDRAALRVLEGKERAGLLEPRTTPDGELSSATVRRLQGWLGLKETGALDPETIGSLQYRTGAPTTGTWDARSFRVLQTYLGLEPDGATSWDERTTTRLQRYLNTQC